LDERDLPVGELELAGEAGGEVGDPLRVLVRVVVAVTRRAQEPLQELLLGGGGIAPAGEGLRGERRFELGLAGDAIPLPARLVHVADVFDILVHERPYKESWTVEAAVAEIERGAGADFDPAVVRAFLRVNAPAS
jgi:hypothetical protein